LPRKLSRERPHVKRSERRGDRRNTGKVIAAALLRELDFAVEGNAVRIRKAWGRTRGRGRSIVEHLRGKATSGMTTDQIIALTRGER
jgi:hypothetical protein